MRRFEQHKQPRPGEVAVSIKLRVYSGCFHRDHSPRAYELIDRYLRALPDTDTTLGFEEHESGPEILALVIVGLGLAKEVIGFVTAIIRARSEGIKKGDRPSDPLHLIVRRIHRANSFREEEVLTIGHTDVIDEARLQQQITTAPRKLINESDPTGGKTGNSKPAMQKKAKKTSERKGTK